MKRMRLQRDLNISVVDRSRYPSSKAVRVRSRVDPVELLLLPLTSGTLLDGEISHRIFLFGGRDSRLVGHFFDSSSQTGEKIQTSSSSSCCPLDGLADYFNWIRISSSSQSVAVETKSSLVWKDSQIWNSWWNQELRRRISQKTTFSLMNRFQEDESQELILSFFLSFFPN